MKCDLCGNPVSSLSTNPYFFNSQTLQLCKTCMKKVESFSENEVPYFQEKSDTASELGKEFIDSLIGIDDNSDGSEIEFEKSDRQGSIQEKPDTTSTSETPGAGLLIMGVIFFIAGIVWYVLSIKDTGYLVVANVQATVFCAGSFVASVVCFACRAVIKALKD